MIFTGGRNIGSCAEGFGVCCACEKRRIVFSKRDSRMNECSSTFPVTLECGDASSQNVTYLVEESASPSDVGPSCTYHICPTDKNVCRIRLDLVAFNIAPPVTGLVIDGDDEEKLQVRRTSFPKKIFYRFFVWLRFYAEDERRRDRRLRHRHLLRLQPRRGGVASHLRLQFRAAPYGSFCPHFHISILSIYFPPSQCLLTRATRAATWWPSPSARAIAGSGSGIYQVPKKTIKLLHRPSAIFVLPSVKTVTQFSCGSEAGGPPGCLQYFTGSSGVISSFNFPRDLTRTATHLSNQFYTVCLRREEGMCSVCYTPATDGVDDDSSNQASFGLS